MKTKLDDLREHLFETIEQLKDEKKPLDIDRARAISQVADTIIKSAKVEVDFLKTTGARPASQFFPEKNPALEAPPRKADMPAKAIAPVMPREPPANSARPKSPLWLWGFRGAS